MTTSRNEIRTVVDPLLLKLRQELYGSGVSFGNSISVDILPPNVVVGGDGGNIEDLVEEAGFIKGVSTYSNGVFVAANQKELNFLGFTITTAGNRTTISGGSGTFNASNYYTKTEVQLLLSAKAPLNHTHPSTDITDFEDAVTNTPAVLANTAKVTNATHTGDVTGSTFLTISNDAVTMNKIADSSALPGQVILYSGGGWIPGYITVGSGISVIHAPTHAIGGSDPLTPAMIGAASTLELDIVRSGLTQSGILHAAVIASPTVLGHIKIGENLDIDPDGTLNAIAADGMQDPTTQIGDMLYRNEVEVIRLPLGVSGTVLRSNGYGPFWATPSGLEGFTAYEEGNPFPIASNINLITIGSGLGVVSYGSGILVFNTQETDLAAHANTWMGINQFGHAQLANTYYLSMTNSGYLTFGGITISGTYMTEYNGDPLASLVQEGIRKLYFTRSRIKRDIPILGQTYSNDDATIEIGMRTENVLGVVEEAATTLYFGDGTTVSGDGNGKVFISAGTASDFIVQSVTNGLTDKAPSSDAVYDFFTGHDHDDLYYTKEEVDGFLDEKADINHTHTSSDITDFDDAVRDNPYVTANTAKISNATHIGEVFGSGYLTISSGVITPNKFSTIGVLEGYVPVFSGGQWHYGPIGSVAISSGNIDGGYWDVVGARIQMRRGENPDNGAFPTPLPGEIILDYKLGEEDVFIGLPEASPLSLRNATKIQNRDVTISSPINNEALIWLAGAWRNEIPPQAVDSDTVDGLHAADFASAAHTSTIASNIALGHIKIGNSLEIDGTGIVNVKGGGGVDVYEDGSLQYDNAFVLDFSNWLNVSPVTSGVRIDVDISSHEDLIASDTILGHVKIGPTITIDPDGTINAPTASGMIDPMTSTGDMIYRAANGSPTRLPIGSSSQVLTVAGGLPTWQTISISGGGSGGATISGETTGGRLYLWSRFS